MPTNILRKNVSSRIMPLFGFVPDRDAPAIYIKREDELHKDISGNKWRKLKYNVEKAIEQNYSVILTFGGAFSNHIAATAAAGKLSGLKTIGLIRGDELSSLNPTLKKAQDDGMTLHFISREEYRLKEDYDYIDSLRTKFGRFLLIPEGGSNYLGINGCMEILDQECHDFDLIVLPVGTGGTLSGVTMSLKEHQSLLGISALKGVDYQVVIRKNMAGFGLETEEIDDIISRVMIQEDVFFGGYARINTELLDFIRAFKLQYDILLDPVYTGKMMFSLLQMLQKGELQRFEKILVIHTGGVQGFAGFEYRGLIKDLHYIGR